MKYKNKRNCLLTGITLAGLFGFSTLANAQSEKTWYFGLSTLPLEITGLEDIHASDWQAYGLGSAEGRISLPLTTGETSGNHPGILVGYKYHNFIGEAQLAVAGGSSSVAGLFGGYLFNIFDTGGLVFSIIPKVGIAAGSINFGEVQVLPGKTPPVITPEGTFNEGDSISASFAGASAQIAASATYDITSSISAQFQAGWTQSFLGDMSIASGDVSLDSDSAALVKNDGTSTQAGINPSASANGIFTAFNISWVF